MRPTRLIFVALSLSISTAAWAQAGDVALEIPFEKYSLDNGLEVILHEDRSRPLVAVSVWYHVGAYHESVGRTGFAHLFEHMMFQGSAHVGDEEHFGILESIGATGMNGTTNFDRTNYFETVPSNQLETALWLESDRMGFLLPALNIGKLDNQRDVVQNERRQSTETRPYGLAEEKIIQTLFPQPHPYYGVVIGSMADLNAATLDDVRKFFKKWYAPSNATLVLAGDFDPTTVKPLIEKFFGSLPKVPKPIGPEVAKVALAGEVVLHHDEPVASLPQVQLVWHSPAFFAPGDAEADLLASILTSGKATRLRKRLVHELELAQSVNAGQWSAGSQSIFYIEAVARPGVDIEQIKVELDGVLEDVRAGKITQAELTRAVNRYETAYVAKLQMLGGFGGRADQLQSYNHFVGDPGYLARDLQRYRDVTLADLKTFANETLGVKRIVAYAIPIEKKAPPAEKPADTAAKKEAN